MNEENYPRKTKTSKNHAIVHEICKKTQSRNVIEINSRWHISGANTNLLYEIEFEIKQDKNVFVDAKV